MLPIYVQCSWLAKNTIKIEWQTNNVDEECNRMSGWIYEFVAGKNYYNFEMYELATSINLFLR